VTVLYIVCCQQKTRTADKCVDKNNRPVSKGAVSAWMVTD